MRLVRPQQRLAPSRAIVTTRDKASRTSVIVSPAHWRRAARYPCFLRSSWTSRLLSCSGSCLRGEVRSPTQFLPAAGLRHTAGWRERPTWTTRRWSLLQRAPRARGSTSSCGFRVDRNAATSKALRPKTPECCLPWAIADGGGCERSVDKYLMPDRKW